jgi:hypothetical protein
MIWERINSATIRAIGYDPATRAVTVERTEGQHVRHVPVPYSVYHAISSARFPEKIYRHLLADHVLPAGVEIQESRGYRQGSTSGKTT